MSITRRLFLRNTAVAGAAATIAGTTVADAQEQSPHERLDAAIAELKAAVQAIWPDAVDWNVKVGESANIPMLIAAMTPIGKEMQAPIRRAKPGAAI